MASKLNICLSSDNNYVQHMAVTIQSLVNCHLSDELNIYILDTSISEENKKKILSLAKPNVHIFFKQINEALFNGFDFSKKTYFTSAIFNRFKIPEFFSDLDRVLYLDVDIVVMKNLSDFYNMDMEGKALAMIADWNENIYKKLMNIESYYNSGVMLFDIKNSLNLNVYSLLMNALKNNTLDLKMPDQDIINLTCQHIIKPVDFTYNTQIHPNLTENIKWIIKHIDDVKILHYTSQLKPWKSKKVPFEKYYFQYLGVTPWKGNIFSIKLRKSIQSICDFIYSTDKIDHNVKYLKFMGIKWFTRIKINGERRFYFLGKNFFNQKRK